MDTKVIIKQKGFTLIELIMVIILISIIFTSISGFIAWPMHAYTDITRRSEMVDSADLALQRMSRDLRRSVPNSVRVSPSNSGALEMMNIVEGMRYRAASPNPYLNMNTTNTNFDVIGLFQTTSLGSNGYRVVIYNTGAYTTNTDNPTAGINLWNPSASAGPYPTAGTHVITPATTTVTLTNPLSTEGNIALNPAFQFALPSARQRIYIVDTPITYLCDLTAKTLTRYWGYTSTAVQPTNPLVAPLSTAQRAILAQDVSACTFNYQSGVATSNAIVELTISITKNNDSIQLFREVSVGNSP
ncbi:MAG: hypothetical protein JWM09_1175 [Francisellaceae bacterium]|nr:hypothetical protein [Francisellaceae bacterium]